jgi:hypothetical protein
MPDPILYVDRSEIGSGKLAEVRAKLSDLVAFIEANEPQLIAYSFFVDEVTSTMTVVAVHPDSASMQLHLDIGGPKFREFASLITLKSIDVYGAPSETVLGQLREKAEMLGGATVTVHALAAGFTRLPQPQT